MRAVHTTVMEWSLRLSRATCKRGKLALASGAAVRMGETAGPLIGGQTLRCRVATKNEGCARVCKRWRFVVCEHWSIRV